MGLWQPQLQGPWCPGSRSSSRAARQEIFATLLSGFPLTDWQKQELTRAEPLPRHCFACRLTLPGPGWHLVGTQELPRRAGSSSTSAETVSRLEPTVRALKPRRKEPGPFPGKLMATSSHSYDSAHHCAHRADSPCPAQACPALPWPRHSPADSPDRSP